jgi:integrase
MQPDGPSEAPTLYAVAVYTYARSNELAALTWDDVDLEHGFIHITKSIDRETRQVKGTKTGTTRQIPIEPALAPVLGPSIFRPRK